MQTIDWGKIWPGGGLGEYDKRENTFEIYSPHVLTQLIGYVKFSYRNDGIVLFRGQCTNHKSMIPSLFRESPSLTSVINKQEKLNNYIGKLIKNRVFMKSTENVAYEALLQHYGIKTRWLDLVDNIWVALWFATHKANSTGKASKYVHYEINNHYFSYIYVMHFGQQINRISQTTKRKIASLCKKEGNFNKFIRYPLHGFFETDLYKIIDLRCMTPSLYMRPHSQHAFLACRKSFSNMSSIDYNDSIVCTIKIETKLALKWLGDGILSQVHFMFPPPTYDPGYRLFLKKGIDPDEKELGSIQHIGA